MQRIITICTAILITLNVFAQVPNKMSYQAIIRNNSNALVTNSAVGMRISILQTTPSGTAVYVETQMPTTNANGLVSIEIGAGTLVSGTFSTIDWAHGPYFIKTETDPNGGANYSIMGSSQLLSVPYALYAENAGNVSDNQQLSVSATGDTLYLQNGGFVIIPGISAANNQGGGGNGIFTPGAGVIFNGYTYASVVLGNGQEWMAENLRTTTYANGDAIPNVANSSQWKNLTTGAWIHYNNDSQYENPYGKLYNWYTVADPRNVCPTGWHVPSDAEWSTFINYLDPNGGSNYNTAGGKMKSTGTQYWLSPNTDATNESGFSGLPGGYRDLNGPFYYIGNQGVWWSSTQGTTNLAWHSNLYSDGGNLVRGNLLKQNGYSVRCLRD